MNVEFEYSIIGQNSHYYAIVEKDEFLTVLSMNGILREEEFQDFDVIFLDNGFVLIRDEENYHYEIFKTEQDYIKFKNHELSGGSSTQTFIDQRYFPITANDIVPLWEISSKSVNPVFQQVNGLKYAKYNELYCFVTKYSNWFCFETLENLEKYARVEDKSYFTLIIDGNRNSWNDLKITIQNISDLLIVDRAVLDLSYDSLNDIDRAVSNLPIFSEKIFYQFAIPLIRYFGEVLIVFNPTRFEWASKIKGIPESSMVRDSKFKTNIPLDIYMYENFVNDGKVILPVTNLFEMLNRSEANRLF